MNCMDYVLLTRRSGAPLRVLNIKCNAQTQVFSANLSRRFQKLMEKSWWI
jgi:hypothetical protein